MVERQLVVGRPGRQLGFGSERGPRRMEGMGGGKGFRAEGSTTGATATAPADAIVPLRKARREMRFIGIV